MHSRFSTNTFPSWERAHPYRYIIHNGEINTVRGNGNWMRAREGMLGSEYFGDDIDKLFPIIHEDGSDSAKFDNALELLTLGGRSLAHGVMMMIPEPWENHETMSAEKRAFYEYHSCLMEPWDGPASVAFTDGVVVGGMLDRNGFRPSRYYIAKDDTLVLSSETGVLSYSAGGRGLQRSAATGTDALDRYGGRPDHQRRGDQAPNRHGASLSGLARRQSGCARRPTRS